MDSYNEINVSKRLDYIRYIYGNTDDYPTVFENFIFPIAVYRSDGRIEGANKFFREIAGLSAEDIRLEGVNIYNYLDGTCENLIDAAHLAFDGSERVYEDICHGLFTNNNISANMIKRYPNAIFFPVDFDDGEVRLAGVLFDKDMIEEEKKSRLSARRNRLLITAAVCAAAAVIAIATIVAINNRPEITNIVGDPVPLQESVTEEAERDAEINIIIDEE